MSDAWRWRRVKEIFDAAVARPEGERTRFVHERCGPDRPLEEDVRSLLAADTRQGAFFDCAIDPLLRDDALAALAGVVERKPALEPGTRFGDYRIDSLIGVGGMGDVYRAHDLALCRPVAVKVLPAHWIAPGGQRRHFEREARVLAALNHPGIGAIYGIEERDGVRALVLELVEGETLAERIGRNRDTGTAAGGLPLPLALDIAVQLAEALEAAHGRGIVHRDLKPSNVAVTRDGRVKVLDFGIARTLWRGPAGDGDGADRQAAMHVEERGGAVPGTAAYASPEQVRGEETDTRTDIWAFGCVLFEMLTGVRAFGGEDTNETLRRVVHQEPDLTLLPDGTPSRVRRVLAMCLEKDYGKRLSNIAIARFLIAEAVQPPASEAPVAAAFRRRRRAAQAWALAALIGALSALVVVRFADLLQAPASPGVTRLETNVTPASQLDALGRPTRTALAIAPDGRTLVFTGVNGDQQFLYVRPLDRAAATPLPGTQGATNPFFSPDGLWIGYWADGAIRKVRISGGPPVHVANVVSLAGASWDASDRIVFAGPVGPLLEVDAAGGTPRALTALDPARGELNHRLPFALPGGDAVLFTTTTDRFPLWDQTRIAVYSRRTGRTASLMDGGANPWYVPTGHLVFVREGVLFAAPFDIATLAVTGDAVAVQGDIMQAAYLRTQRDDTGAAQVAISETGTLVYAQGGTSPPPERSVVAIDRTGRAEPLPVPRLAFATLRLSPDGRRLALGTFGQARDIWVYSFEHGTLTRLPIPGRSSVPVWTPDGDRISYATGTGGPDHLGWIRADGTGTADPLVRDVKNLVPATWTPDRGRLLFYDIPPRAVRSTDVAGTGAQAVVVEPSGEAAIGGADLSPDGRWIAYHSNESGRSEIYVQAFPAGTPRHQVSRDGGVSPVWRGDGRELFYLEPLATGVRVIAVPVTPLDTFRFGRATELFRGRYEVNQPARAYDVTANGGRFLFLQEHELPPERVTRLTVVQNWFDELRRLVPSR